ncbi:MAG: sigma-70 family RNA polymerase sigma factor, partial [Planctomycetota bacterium]
VHHQDAEDAVQDIFIEIWRTADKYNPEIGSESNYIAMIAKRRLIDRYRRRSRDLETTMLVEESVASEAEHEKQAEISEEAGRVRGYMRELRPQEQRVLELAINDGLSQSQIADATDLPLGTVKTHSRRGLVRLRELLGVQAAEKVKRERP